MKKKIDRNKVTKEIKLLITYREFEGGGKYMQYDDKKSKEIERWIAERYINELFMKNKI